MRKPKPTKGSKSPRLDLQSSHFIIDGKEYALVSFPLIPADVGQLLTATEVDVVARVLDGHSNASIALTRETSARTIANQLASIYRKLDIGSRRELIARCTAHDDKLER